jgi:hypothetical protein
MAQDTPDPASAAARTGSGDAVCFGGEQFPDSARAQEYQAQNSVRRFGVRYLRLVLAAPPPRRRRLSVQINVLDGRAPYGRGRLLRLRESDLAALIAEAERLERAS